MMRSDTGAALCSVFDFEVDMLLIGLLCDL